MNSCCSSAMDGQFGKSVARSELRVYRRRGPFHTTRTIIDTVRQHGASRASLLDIGGGIGVLHHELLGEVVDTAIQVDPASAFIAEARAECERRGHAEAVRFIQGDFVDLAEDLPEADIVTLDRVICCYPDYRRLVVASAAKARKLYAFSYLREKWYVKAVIGIQNAFRRLRGSAFRTYVHPTRHIEELLADAGWERSFYRVTAVWQVEAYVRS